MITRSNFDAGASISSRRNAADPKDVLPEFPEDTTTAEGTTTGNDPERAGAGRPIRVVKCQMGAQFCLRL
jgi:hypothetical protein